MKFMNLWNYYNNKSNQLKYPNVLKDILNHTHEKEIAKTNSKWAFEYASEHGRDKELEPAIAKDTLHSLRYTDIILKKDFYLDGKLIYKYEG